jgi:hypothetical protein
MPTNLFPANTTMKSFLSALILLVASAADAFAPSVSLSAQMSTITALHATTQNNQNVGGGTSSRRQLFQSTFTTVASTILLPQLANAATDTSVEDYAKAIEQSTQLLSQKLGHALSVIDGLNAQARRLGSSSTPNTPTHSIAVLDGMNSQAKRLISDLSTSEEILSTIKSQAKSITVSDETFREISGDVAHATSVLDGLMAQSKRLVSASTADQRGYSTDEQIVYMLSVLDGLNAQVRRMDGRGEDMFKILDELNAKAAKALL